MPRVGTRRITRHCRHCLVKRWRRDSSIDFTSHRAMDFADNTADDDICSDCGLDYEDDVESVNYNFLMLKKSKCYAIIMAALCNREAIIFLPCGYYLSFLWSPYVIRQTIIFMATLCNRGAIIFLPCSFFPSFFILLLFPRLISAAVDRMSAILLHMAWP